MKLSRQAATISNDLADIIAISERSASAKDSIRILELSTLSDLIPHETAEKIRETILRNGVQVRQLTNVEQFQPWTEVPGFIAACMQVRHIPDSQLPVHLEMLLFDNVVAMYRVEPIVSLIIIEDEAFAAQQRALFDTTWERARPLTLLDNGGTAA